MSQLNHAGTPERSQQRRDHVAKTAQEAEQNSRSIPKQTSNYCCLSMLAEQNSRSIPKNTPNYCCLSIGHYDFILTPFKLHIFSRLFFEPKT